MPVPKLMSFRLCVLLTALLLPLVAAAQSPIPDGAEPERIAQGFQFTEGPLWVDGALLFSDIPANTIYRWTPDEGSTVYRTPSQKSNGLALDTEGHLLLAQHGARRVSRLVDGTETPIATSYDGNALNSPNDLVVHPDGSIYFTDPTWGLEGRPSQLGFTGVYRLDTAGQLTLLVDSLHQPNGIAFSPDVGTLYVSTSDERTVVAYDLADHTVSNGRVFARLTGGTPSDAADGMEIDAEGNLWVAGPRGVWVFDAEGTVLDVVDVPGQTTNVAWGDADGQTLYITSGPDVYRLRVGTSTATEDDGPERAFAITGVSPHPTRDAARIAYRLDAPGFVSVTLFDALGREVRILDRGPRSSGGHTLLLDLGDLPSGWYLVRLATGAGAVSRPLILAR